MQEWRKGKTCSECAELAHMVDVDQFGRETEWWQCLQDGHETRPYLAACPIINDGDSDED